jgi:hypothetical protein
MAGTSLPGCFSLVLSFAEAKEVHKTIGECKVSIRL